MDPQKLTVLNEVLEKLALGDYGARCEISPENDELDTIANSINKLAEKFEIAVTERNQAREDLEALNRHLEGRIEDRTAELRESEALMRLVTDSVPVCLAYVDAGHRFGFNNKLYGEWFGFPQGSLKGKHLRDVMGEDAYQKTRPNIEKTMAGNKVFFEGEMDLKGTGPRYLESVYVPHFGEDGEVLGYSALVRDITERKRMEAGFKAGESHLQAVFDTLPHIVAIKDTEGRYVKVNRAMSETFGMEPEDYVGLLPSEVAFRPAEDTQNAETEDRKVLGGKQAVVETEYRRISRQGEVITFLGIRAPLKDETGKVTGMVAVSLDINERKKAEEKLKESEERFRGTLEHLPLAMTLKDKEGRYQYINQRFEEWFGFSKKDSIGKFYADLFPLRDAELSNSTDREVMVEEKAMERETQAEFTDGQEHFLRNLKFPVYGANGQVNGVGVILSDITEQRRAENQLLQSQKMDAIGQLAGGVAHDFNNMLQVIQGYVGLSLDDQNISSDTKSHLNQVQKAADRAASLTRQLLAFSRQQILEEEVFDLNTLIGDQMKMLRRVIGEEIELVLHSRAPMLPVLADAGMIDQVMMNLCINARDAMPAGGRLLIETSAFTASPEFLAENSWAREGSYAQITVNDSGTGVAPEVREKIFDPFFTTKEQGKGTGLGLSMVYGILQQHEGMITIDSQPGQGTTFTFYLPMVENQPEVLEAEKANEKAGGSETILIAEDEPDVLDLAVLLLEAKGYAILTAVNGEEAVEVFNRRGDGIDLVILDVVMPKLGGHQVLEIIKKTRPALPVLLTTGYSPGRFELGGISENRVKMIQKPFNPAELFHTVRELIDME